MADARTPGQIMPFLLSMLPDADEATRTAIQEMQHLDPATLQALMAKCMQQQKSRPREPALLQSGQICMQGNCVVTALYNQRFYRTNRDKSLRLVVGSLGLGCGEGKAVWWEWGNPTWTSAEQFTKNKPCGVFDGHVWLVDDSDNGAVYDVLPPDVWEIAQIHQRVMSCRQPEKAHLVERQSVAELARIGLHYAAAPAAVADSILAMYVRVHGPVNDATLNAFTSAAVRS